MAASKTTKRKTGGSRSSGRKAGRKKKTTSDGFQNEIILIVILAAALITMAGNFGLGGNVGDAISSFLFGIVGIMAYVFPIFLFLGSAFLISNKGNAIAWRKMIALFAAFLILCGMLQLLTDGYMASSTLMDYYKFSSGYHSGGGIVGGALCISMVSAFGMIGAYIIMILVLLVCLIHITQKSFFDFINRFIEGIIRMVQGGQQRYEEGRPERDLKRELRAQQRQNAAAQRRAERMKRLEEALAAEEKEKAEVEKPAVKRKTKTVKPTHFLEGTELAPRTSGGMLVPEEASMPEQQAEFSIQRSGNTDPVTEASKTQAPVTAPPVSFEEQMAEVEMQRVSGMQEIEIQKPEVQEIEEQEPEIMEPEPMSEEQPIQETAASRQPSKNPKSSPGEIENGIRNIQHEINQQEAVKKEYQFPPLKLLKNGSGKVSGESDAQLRKTAQKLQDILYNFGVNATVTNVSCGPTVTRYELQPELGVKVSKIVGLADDIKLNLAAADIRIEAPIPGKAAVGIEVPNKENSPVMLRELLQSTEFQDAKSKLAFAAGKDIAGKPVVTDIAKMPHLLIAGATGSGKSVCINTLIISILYKAKPEEVKLIMIDPKVVELSVYNGIPHLFIPVVTDPKKAAGALNWAVSEMTNRYNTFAEYGVRNLAEYNKKIETMHFPEGEVRPDKMPQIVIIVDELADLMMVAPGEVEDAICRLAQLARAAGIHLVIATQRPSVNVITGLIKANMPSRIAFSVSSGVDSRTILDMNGAEKLLGKGDMLFYPQGYQKPARLQGAFVSDEEVSSVVNYLTNKNPRTTYDQQIEQQMTTVSFSSASSDADERDVYFEEAGKFLIDKERASIGMLQRMFKIGFNRAARIMDQLSDAGVVGPEEGTKPRKILMSQEEFQTFLEEH